MARNYKYLLDEEREVSVLGVVVNRGDVVEVEDPAVADGLDGQTDVWEHIPDPERSKAAKKAAETRAANDDSQEG